MKKIIISVFLLLGLSIIFTQPVNAQEQHFYDQANLLDYDNQENLNEQLNKLSNQYDFDIFVVTTSSLGNKTSTEYADDFFDEHFYGKGSSGEDGILLLVSMEDRDWAISTCGKGIDIFTDRTQELLMDKILPSLSDGEYYDAFYNFGKQCQECIENPSTLVDEDKKGDFSVKVVASVVVGIVFSLVTVISLKMQLKSVRHQAYAGDYLNNFKLTNQRDYFLYTTTSRTKKQESTSRSGSSTHRSSSGRTHGGSHGHF